MTRQSLASISPSELESALGCIDWGQVVFNGGPPCFHIEDGRFCLRAERWAGHSREAFFHHFVSIDALVRETHGMNGQSAHAVSPQPTETPEESANKEAISVILNPDQWKVVLQALNEQVTLEGMEDEVATCIENQTEGLL